MGFGPFWWRRYARRLVAIVGGALRGRRLEAPRAVTRPTSARVREAIASALESRDAIIGARVLDLFAGTGALSFEALSRGAASAELVDLDAGVIKAVRRSANALGLDGRVRVRRGDVFRNPTRMIGGPYDLVFLDPPYARVGELGEVFQVLASTSPDATLVLESGREAHDFDAFLFHSRSYEYGDTHVTIAALREHP